MQTQTKTQTITATNTTATVEPFPYFFKTLDEYKDLMTSDDVHQRYIQSYQAKIEAVRWALRVKKQHGLETVRHTIEAEMQKLHLDLDPWKYVYMVEFETRVLGRLAQELSVDYWYHTP